MSRYPEWTTGPWIFAKHGDRYRIIDAEQELAIAYVPIEPHWPSRANASLISAAPELYDVLDSFFAWATDAPETLISKAHAALSKARGES